MGLNLLFMGTALVTGFLLDNATNEAIEINNRCYRLQESLIEHAKIKYDVDIQDYFESKDLNNQGFDDLNILSIYDEVE